MSAQQEQVERFWGEYLRTLPSRERRRSYLEAFSFGHSEDSATRLAALVVEGRKTATSELLWSREARGQGVWKPGDESIVVDGEGRPVCVIRTTQLRVLAFDEVDEDFIREYGEGDGTLEWWRTEVWKDYARECVALGRPASPEMPVICERFEVVWPRS